MEWNSLRLLFSVSESEIVSTWWQGWGVSRQGWAKALKPFPRSQGADPANMICLNRTADPEVRCIKVTTSELRSPLARGDGARMRDNDVGKAV